jgi:hypothetical protein
MLFTFRNVTQDLPVMLTLTYPEEFPTDGRVVKRHWITFRKWLMRRGLSGLWFLEFQERGAPHFHVFLNGRVPAEEVSKHWFKVVGSGDIKHLYAGTKVELLREQHAAAAYAVKYAVKAEQKGVPEGFEAVGRFWGRFGGAEVVPVAEAMGTREAVAPAVRVVRGVVNAKRKQQDRPPMRDKGQYSFTGWGAGPAVSSYLDRQEGAEGVGGEKGGAQAEGA